MEAITQDQIILSLEFGIREANYKTFEKTFIVLQSSFFAKPTALTIEDSDEIPVTSFTDKAIKTELEKLTWNTFQLFSTVDDSHYIGIVTNKGKAGVDIWFNKETLLNHSQDVLLGLFTNLLIATQPLYARICWRKHAKKMFQDYYMTKKRTFLSSGLLWLQYYSGEELRRQGGIEAIEKNPYIKTERIGEGLLVQVGESIYDALTPEGEALLVKATEAMPPASWK